MKQLVWIGVGCLFFSVVGSASPPKALMSDLTTTPLDRAITRVKDLPPRLQTALAKTFIQDKLYLGNPKEPIGGELLVSGDRQYPERRLIFAFETLRYYIVYVEYGPPAVHASVLVFDKTIRFVWGGVDLRMPPFAASPKEVAKMIKLRKFREGRFIW
jgi:hypothetical protein